MHNASDINVRINLSFNEVNNDAARLSLINTPINRRTQSKGKKKQNAILYWEEVDRRIKMKMLHYSLITDL
jgi:competence transcription factor ComK